MLWVSSEMSGSPDALLKPAKDETLGRVDGFDDDEAEGESDE